MYGMQAQVAPMMPGQQMGMMQSPQGMMMQQPGMMMQPNMQQAMMMQQQAMMQQQHGMMMQQQPGMMMQQPGIMMPQVTAMQPTAPMMAGQMMVAQTMGAMPMMAAQPAIQYVYLTPENPWGPLEGCNSIVIEQEMDMLEVMTGGAIEIANRYRFYTDKGGRSYYAWEESEMCNRQCCAPNHKLTMHIHSHDKQGPELFRMEKPFKCCCMACGPCCQKEATVKMANGEIVGYIQQPCGGGGCTPTLNIYDKPEGELLSTVTGPFLLGSLCSTTFQVNHPKLGNIATFEKKGVQDMADLVKAIVSDADKFQMNFKVSTDNKLKAVMLGTLLFMDYVFFEGDQACGSTNPFTGEVNCVCCNMYCFGSTIPCGCKMKPDQPPR